MSFNLKRIFSVLLPAIIISLLFVTPFMVSDEIYNGVIMAKEFWFFGVVALMLFYSAIMLLINKEKLRIEFNITDILLLAFYTWCFIRAIFTPYTPFYHNHKLQIFTGMMVLYFFVKNAIRNERNENYERNEENENSKVNDESGNNSFIPSFIHSFINRPSFILSFLIFSFIFSGFLQAIFGLLQLYGIYPSHHSLFKITGSFFNPAPYAMYLAVVFPVALGKMLFNERNEENEENENNKAPKNSFIFSFFHSFIGYLPAVTVVVILLVLPATMNRASWLGTAAGSLVVLQYRYNWWRKIRHWLNTLIKKILAITGVVIVICGICLSLFYLKAGSSNGRLFIWEVTLGKIAEKPLFGHGLGRFEAEYNNWQAEYFMKHPEEMDGPKGWVAGNTKYAFNEFLEMVSEIGLVGFLIFIIWVLSVILKNNKFGKPYGNKLLNEQNLYLFVFPSFLTVIFCSLISYPFYSLPTLILSFFLTGILSVIKNNDGVLKIKINRHLFALITLCFAFVFSSFLTNLTYYRKWMDAGDAYKIGDFNNANLKYQNCVNGMQNEPLLLQEYGKSLQMSGMLIESLEKLTRAMKLTSDQVLYTTLGNLYMSLKLYKESEEMYKHAVYMQPNRLFPQYLLAKLYFESGQKAKAQYWAKKILFQKPKIENQAEIEIKSEMKKLLYVK